MRKIKRLIALMGAALLAALTPAGAMAATGGYVPTAAICYNLDNGQWVQESTFQKSYKKDGRITKKQSISTAGEITTTTYAWKGNYLKKITTAESSGGTGTEVYKYKKKLRKSCIVTNGAEIMTYSYKWKKKKGTFTATSGDGSLTITGTVKVNGKNQIVSEVLNFSGYSDPTWEKYTRKFYSNGNLKEYRSLSSEGQLYIAKYNKKGYLTSETFTSAGYSYTNTYTYKMDKKKKCPKEQILTWTDSRGESGGYRAVYTSFKKVSRVRNCDASGVDLPLDE